MKQDACPSSFNRHNLAILRNGIFEKDLFTCMVPGILINIFIAAAARYLLLSVKIRRNRSAATADQPAHISKQAQ